MIAMSRMPGRPVTEYDNLRGVEKQMIKGKVTGIFECVLLHVIPTNG